MYILLVQKIMVKPSHYAAKVMLTMFGKLQCTCTCKINTQLSKYMYSDKTLYLRDDVNVMAFSAKERTAIKLYWWALLPSQWMRKLCRMSSDSITSAWDGIGTCWSQKSCSSTSPSLPACFAVTICVISSSSSSAHVSKFWSMVNYSNNTESTLVLAGKTLSKPALTLASTRVSASSSVFCSSVDDSV